jgi:hypothetical protein
MSGIRGRIRTMLTTPAPTAKPAEPATPPSRKQAPAPPATPVAGASTPVREAAVDDAYRSGLEYLGAQRAAGRLDSDLALKAAEQLGHRYRERRAETVDGARRRAAQQIHAELVGEAFPAFDAEARRLGALLAELRRPDHQPSPGWEQEVIAAAARLNGVITRVADLARSHASTHAPADRST